MKRHRTVLSAVLGLFLLAAAPASELPDQQAVAARIIGAALVDGRAYDTLTYLCDRIGHRLSGSKGMERAVAWTAEELERAGADRVWTESMRVPHWVRGEASAMLTAPIEEGMPVLALGGSIATPPEGIEAEVVIVEGFEELEALGDAVAGKIVLFNRQIEPGFGERGYGWAVGGRVNGAARAARFGAVAHLVRSLGTAHWRLPHTGAMNYEEGTPKIPSAAIATEDADRMVRLIAAGETVRLRLKLGCKTLDDVESANVLAELTGREKPEEIVLIGAHLDSWDVGQGAHDDGSGVAAVIETIRLLKALDLRPRRTIRAVLFTNEENGLRGGRDYAERHGRDQHVAAIESDSGGHAPRGFGVTAGNGGVALLESLSGPLKAIDADTVFPRGGGADIGPLMRATGTPGLALVQDTTHYFDFHHTEADTLDKVDPDDLARNAAAMAYMAWALAEHPETLIRIPPPDSARP